MPGRRQPFFVCAAVGVAGVDSYRRDGHGTGFRGSISGYHRPEYAAVRKANREPHCISDEFFAGRTGGCAQGIHYACRFAEVQIGLVGQCEYRKTGIVEERTYRDGKTSGRHSGSGDGGMVEAGAGFVMPNWGRRALCTVR